MTAITVNGTAGNDTLVITATDFDNGSYVFDLGGPVNLPGPSAFTFNGNAGNDAFTIMNPAGDLFTPINGLTFNGGGQTGDSFSDLGGAAGGGIYSAGLTPNAGTLSHLVDEVQRFTVTGGTGTFTLTFNGQTTGSLAFNATAAQVATALDGLSTIGGVLGSVIVTQNGGVYTVTFGGDLADANEPQITASGTGGASVATQTLRDGGSNVVQLTGVATVTDTVAEPNFTINGTSGADAITVFDGPIVGGHRTMQLRSPTFQTLDIANKDAVSIGGNGGGDTVTFDNPDAAASLTTLVVTNVTSVAGSNPSGSDLTVPILLLLTDADIGAGRALKTQINTLEAVAGLAGAGSININNGVTTPTTLDIDGLQATNAAGGAIVLTNDGTINVLTFNAGITATNAVMLTANSTTADINTGNQSSAAITSNTGSVSLQAGRDINLGDNSGNGSVNAAAGIAVTAGRNLVLNANASISNTASGNILVLAGGNLTMLTSPGSVLDAPEFVNTASGGSITLVAGAGYTMTLDTTGTDAVASSNGTITLSADAMVINKGVTAGTARVVLDTASPGQAISLGGANLPGVLGLSQAELNEVSAGVLQIGSAGAGNITLASSVTPTPNSNVMTLVSNGGISENPGASLAAFNLRIDASDAVSLDNANNAIQSFAGSSTSAVTIVDSVSLTVGAVDGDVGISSGGPIDLVADNLNLAQAVNAGTGVATIQPLSSTQQIALGGSDAAGTLGLSNIELGRVTASVLRVDSNSGNITVSNAISRHAGYKTLSLETGGGIFQAAALSVANLALRSADGIFLTNVGNDANALAFANIGGSVLYTDANKLTIGAVDGLSGSSNTGGITMITAGGNIVIGAKLFSAGAATLTSTAWGITDLAAADVVTAPTLQLSAAAGIGTVSTLVHTQVNDIGADTINGGIFITNGVTTGVTLNVVGTDGVVASGSTGNIELINQGSIVSLANGDTIRGPGTVTVRAQGATSDFTAGGQSGNASITAGVISVQAGRDINLGDATGFGKLIAGTGSITLSTGRNINLNANTIVVSVSGGITATAGGNITMATSPGTVPSAPVFATGGGTVALSAGVGHSITLATTGTAAVSSGGGDIFLTGDVLHINAGVDAGGGNVLIKSANVNAAISLGTATGGLHLSQAGLNEVTANTLTIGTVQASSVTIGGTVDPGSVSAFTIKSGSNVTMNNTATLGGSKLTNLTLTAGGSFLGGVGSKISTSGSGTVSIGFGTKGLGGTADLHSTTITAAKIGVTGGAGNDTFTFSVATLTAAVTVAGGAGTNKLVMTTGGTIKAGGVSAVETFQLAGGLANTLTLTSANFAGVGGHVITVNDGSAGNTITASTLPLADAIIVHAGTGTDTLKGGAGNDTFFAGGKTTMTGGAGANKFTFADIGTNTIADFGASASNEIVLRNSGFNLGADQGLGTGTPKHLAASVFVANSTGAFTTTSQRFAYNTTTGALRYSADGSGSASSAVAVLTGHPGLSAGSTGNLFFTS